MSTQTDPIYWCDACQHEDSLVGASFAHCEKHGTIFNPVGCTDFMQKK